MKVDIILDALCIKPKIEIHTNKITEEINDIAKTLASSTSSIIGYKNDLLTPLKPKNIIKIYSEDKKVYASTLQDTYTLKLRLYEIEENISNDKLIRISKSEIVNFDYVKNLDLSLNGTIKINFKNGDYSYVSRRYINKIKNHLGIWGVYI